MPDPAERDDRDANGFGGAVKEVKAKTRALSLFLIVSRSLVLCLVCFSYYLLWATRSEGRTLFSSEI